MKFKFKIYGPFLVLMALCSYPFLNDKRIQYKESAPVSMDTIEYWVAVAADRPGVEYFGGEEEYIRKVARLFDQSNEFWNNGSDQFTYYFRFIPEVTLIYDGCSKEVENTYKHNIDSTRYDALLIIDSVLDHEEEKGKGGWYCYEGPDYLSVVACRGRSETEHEDIFDKGYRGIAHEFGHSRGVTDLYANRIREQNNPVNQILYEPDSCIMNNHHKTSYWSSYAVNIINHTARSKRVGRDFPGFFRQMFPENIEVLVKVKGEKKDGVKLNLYGSRAKHNDLIPIPYRTYETNTEGVSLISGVPGLYNQPEPPLYTDELPYNRWFTFVLEAEYEGEKKYVWLPEYDVQNTFFENKDTYYVEIEF